jgi:hypothetical protein
MDSKGHMKIYDHLVVGSGCSGAMAAQTLVDAGVNVTMIDPGFKDEVYQSLIPDKDFVTIRQTEKDQYKYLIGEEGEGIAWGSVSKGAQITPPRQHINKFVDKYIPTKLNNFSPLESLAYGGLGAGWGLQCWEFSKPDMERAGLPEDEMRKAYEIVSERIGISATKDNASNYTIGSLKNFQQSPRADRNHTYILNKYSKRRQKFKNKGLFIGRTPLALITKDTNDRAGYKYRGLDFYNNHGNSAWRPPVTIDNLKQKNNFEYLSSLLVVDFVEKKDFIAVNCIDTEKDKPVVLRCKRLILASGALGSARIVLRSMGQPGSKLPLLSNPHSYIPCIQPAMMGKGTENNKLGLGQVSYFIDKNSTTADLSVASSYSYQSLMLFRIINQVPLNFSDARVLFRYLMSGLVILLVQHPDNASEDKYLELVKDKNSPTGDKLKINYNLDNTTEKKWLKREKQYMSAMRKLGTYPLKRVDPGHGSSIHYAGTIPFSDNEQSLTLSRKGRLHGCKNVFVADSSGFNYLPAPGLTFSLMANAHLVAEEVLKNGQ